MRKKGGPLKKKRGMCKKVPRFNPHGALHGTKKGEKVAKPQKTSGRRRVRVKRFSGARAKPGTKQNARKERRKSAKNGDRESGKNHFN